MSYLKKIVSTGAIRKTPQRIIDKISNEVTRREDAVIVEVGAGRGEITRALVDGHGKSNYFALELDADFCEELRAAFPQIHVLNYDAMKLYQAGGIPSQVDYFISSIPLSFYEQMEIENFCKQITLHLKPGGKLIILFTAFWLIATIKKALPNSRLEAFATMPPYFLAVYENAKNKS